MKRRAAFVLVLLLCALPSLALASIYQPQPVRHVSDNLVRSILTRMDAALRTLNQAVPDAGAFNGASIALDGSISGTVTIRPAATTTSHSLTLPSAQGAASSFLGNNGSGTLSWSGITNVLLDGSRHTDTVAQTVSRGSLIYGNATPKWDELTIGAAGTILKADGTDASWGTINLLSATIADAVAANVVRGDVIVGNATPKWSRLAIGGSGTVLTSNGTDASWTAPTTVASGVYTPTRSGEANLDANVTMAEAQYLRVGATVTVSGRFTADPTLTATTTSFEITLPVASNLGAAEDAAGTAFCGAIAAQGAEVTGSAANDHAVITWKSTDVTSQSWSFHFSYQVI